MNENLKTSKNSSIIQSQLNSSIAFICKYCKFTQKGEFWLICLCKISLVEHVHHIIPILDVQTRKVVQFIIKSIKLHVSILGNCLFVSFFVFEIQYFNRM